jgi:hypothetical protein
MKFILLLAVLLFGTGVGAQVPKGKPTPQPRVPAGWIPIKPGERIVWPSSGRWTLYGFPDGRRFWVPADDDC